MNSIIEFHIENVILAISYKHLNAVAVDNKKLIIYSNSGEPFSMNFSTIQDAVNNYKIIMKAWKEALHTNEK